jgi:hypothetical protein
MKDLQEKIKEAKKDGYTDDEIVQFLAQLPEVGSEISAALKNQYQPSEIVKFLGQSPAYREGTQAPTGERALVTALQGPTFQFLDELAGAVSAPFKAVQQGIPLGEAYRQGRDIVRGKTESFEAERPFTAGGAQLAASLPMAFTNIPTQVGRTVLPMLQRTAPSIAPTVQRAGTYIAGTPAAGQVMGLGQRTAQAGASGAGYGFIGGVGASTADNPLDVLSDAATSAVFGGAFGAGTQPAMSVLGAGGRQIAARSGVLPGAVGTQAQQKVAEALIRDVPAPLDPGNALNRAQARLLKLGPEARIADVGGQSTFNLLDLQATLPGTTATAVKRATRERQVGSGPRLMAATDETLGTQGAQFTQSIENFKTQRFNESRPYYAVVDSANVMVDNQLIDLLKKSRDLHAKAEGLYNKATGTDIDLSQLKYGEPVPMVVLDKLKDALYDSAQSLKRSGENNSARLDDDVRVKLTEFLTDRSPKIGNQSAYGLAMKTYAGPSQMLDAADIGRQVMKGDILDVQQATRGFSQSEMEAYRIGVLQALRQQTGTESGRTSLLKFYKEDATKDRLKAAFGNDYKAFSAAVLREGQLKQLEAAGRGSQTAARLAGEEDLDIAPLSQAASALTSGNPSSIITTATNLARQAKTPESVRNEIGRILLSRDPRQLEQLSEVIRQLNRSRARAAGVSGFGAGQIGSMISDNPMP